MRTIFIAIIGFTIGGFIYVLFRSESLQMFNWFAYLKITNRINDLRTLVLPYSTALPKWFYNSLPNACWAFSGTILFYGLWGTKYPIQKLFWLTIFWLFALGLEIGQLVGLVNGTFDFLDLILTVIFCFFAIVTGQNLINKKREESTL